MLSTTLPFYKEYAKKILCLSLSAMGKPIVWVIQESIKLDKANALIDYYMLLDLA